MLNGLFTHCENNRNLNKAGFHIIVPFKNVSCDKRGMTSQTPSVMSQWVCHIYEKYFTTSNMLTNVFLINAKNVCTTLNMLIMSKGEVFIKKKPAEASRWRLAECYQTLNQRKIFHWLITGDFSWTLACEIAQAIAWFHLETAKIHVVILSALWIWHTRRSRRYNNMDNFSAQNMNLATLRLNLAMLGLNLA